MMILDGGMGSMLCDIMAEHRVNIPDILTLYAPEAIYSLHLAYLESGADIISTNTFNANPLSLQATGISISNDEVRNLNAAAVQLARKAIARYTETHPESAPKFIAGVIGPGTEFFSRKDIKSLSALRDSYRVQVEALSKAGVDIFLIETVFDLTNLRQALTTVSEAISQVISGTDDMPQVMVSATINPATGKLPSGDSLEDFVNLSLEYGFIKIIGINCCEGPKGLEESLKTITRLTAGKEIAVSVHPSAGLLTHDGRYPYTPDAFASAIHTYAEKGHAQILGGCCGTTPQHIRLINT